MSAQLVQRVRRGLRRAGDWLWLQLEEAAACRTCARTVNPLANICQYCGTGYPVRVNLSPVFLITAFGCEAVLLLM